MAKTSARKRETVSETRALDMDDMEESLGFRLWLAQNTLFREFSERFGALGLTQSLYAIMVLIQRNPGSRQMELGWRSASARPTWSNGSTPWSAAAWCSARLTSPTVAPTPCI